MSLLNKQYKIILQQNARRYILNIIKMPKDLRLLTNLYKLMINNKILRNLIFWKANRKYNHKGWNQDLKMCNSYAEGIIEFLIQIILKLKRYW